MYKFVAVALVALSLAACGSKEETAVEPVVEPTPAPEVETPAVEAETVPAEGVTATADPAVAQ